MATARPPALKADPKHCRLMTGENCSTEIIELNDPVSILRGVQ